MFDDTCIPIHSTQAHPKLYRLHIARHPPSTTWAVNWSEPRNERHALSRFTGSNSIRTTHFHLPLSNNTFSSRSLVVFIIGEILVASTTVLSLTGDDRSASDTLPFSWSLSRLLCPSHNHLLPFTLPTGLVCTFATSQCLTTNRYHCCRMNGRPQIQLQQAPLDHIAMTLVVQRAQREDRTTAIFR